LKKPCTDGHQGAFFFPNSKLKEYVFPFFSAASTRFLPTYSHLYKVSICVFILIDVHWQIRKEKVVKKLQNAYYRVSNYLVHEPITNRWHVLNKIHDSEHRLHAKDLRIKVAIWKF